MSNHILTDTHKSMTPMVVEVLIFLKVNDRFWDQDLVCRAIAMACTERSEQDAAQEEVAYGLDGGEGD
jgi:hypothetical protein